MTSRSMRRIVTWVLLLIASGQVGAATQSPSIQACEGMQAGEYEYWRKERDEWIRGSNAYMLRAMAEDKARLLAIRAAMAVHLLRKGANPTLLDADRRTPLWWAQWTSNLKVMPHLQEYPTERTRPLLSDMRTTHAALGAWAHAAHQKVRVEIAQRPVTAREAQATLVALLNAPQTYAKVDATALHQVQAAVASGADLNAPCFEWGTALHQAIRYESLGWLGHLIRLGADPNGPDANGRRPLHFVAELPPHTFAPAQASVKQFREEIYPHWSGVGAGYSVSYRLR